MRSRIRYSASLLIIATLVLAACAGIEGGIQVTAANETSPMVGATPPGQAVQNSPSPQTENPGQQSGGEDNTLTSVLAQTAPNLDGLADEEGWTSAPATVITTAGGANASDTQVTIKSLYDTENVYFLLTWADPTQSWQRNMWEKQADGSWKIQMDPKNRGGDENVYYEDKISLIWNINDSIPNFAEQGCFTACHVGENSDVKPYGNKYTSEEGQLGDIWHWKSIRNVRQVDDQYLSHLQYSPDTPEAGRRSDDSMGGGYKANETEDKRQPAFMQPGGGDKRGAPGFITDEEKVPFDDSLFAAGDLVPGVVVAPFQNDRGDISAGWQHVNGAWMLEFSRKLTTGSEADVQFNDLGREYHFGLATFDNTQVRHAFQSGSTVFRFERAR